MKLQEIQQKLKVPKGVYSNFGQYHYRTIDDILERLKPLLGDSLLYFTDGIKEVGGFRYVESTAIFKDGNEIVSVTASAREEEERKKTVAPQLTGSASTYARKRALEGLFLLNNSEDDPDKIEKVVVEEEEEEEEKPKPNWPLIISEFRKRPYGENRQKIIDRYTLTDDQLEELDKLVQL